MNLHRIPPNEYESLIEDIWRMQAELERLQSQAIISNSPLTPTREQVGEIFMSRRVDVLILALEGLKNIEPTTEWTADIGSWEKGRNVDLPGVSNLKEAIEKAILSNDIDSDSYVVQIYHNGKTVWDYMNGSSCYQNDPR